MPWSQKELGDVCDFIGGSQPPKSEFVYDISGLNKEDYVRLIQIRDYKSDNYVVYIPKNRTKKFCTKDDIMIGRYGPPVFQILKGIEGAYNVALMKAVPKDANLDSEYLFKFLESPPIQDYIIKLSERAAGQTGVNKKALHCYPILIPPLPEQKLIVQILDQAFAGIEKARANAEKNLKNARELFDSYLQKVFTEKGEGWEEKTIGEVVKLARGHNPPKKDFIFEPKKGYVRFYQIRDGKSDRFATYVPETPKLHRVKKDDILMVAYRHVGGAFRGVEGAFNVALCKLYDWDRSVMLDDFLYNMIPTYLIKGELLKASERSLIPSMSVKHLATLKIPIPPIEKQKVIVSQMNELQFKIKNIEAIYTQKIASLDEFKKSLLQKAFSGELTKEEFSA